MSAYDFSKPMIDDHYSYGDWDNEKDSVTFLKDILKRSGLFTIYNEITGHLLHPKPFNEHKDLRIDIIASPTPKMLKSGWLGGPIGIECKKSNIKINEAFAQVQDYTRTVWCIPTGFMFMCQYYFIWPYHKNHGFIASQMAQNRIGTLEHTESFGVSIKAMCGEARAFKYEFKEDKTEIGKLDFGFKTGSR